jgi:L,D-transpeptidase ErfK/SrfK
MRLYFYPVRPRFGDPVVVTYPVSIGRMDWSTPLGRHRVTAKVKDPSWTPPKSIIQEALDAGEPPPKFMPPGPDNPLGAYAIRLDIPGYLIHGTDRPYGVGMRVTHGCMRMYPEDIERLFEQVPVGTPVNIVNQPVKVGWLRDTVFMEVHPPLEEDPQDDETLQGMAWEQIEQVVGNQAVELLVPDIMRTIREKRGVPVAISRGSEL